MLCTREENYGMVAEGAWDDTGKSIFKVDNQNEAVNTRKTKHK